MTEKKIINIGQPGDKATVPRIARRLNQSVMAAQVNEIAARLEEALRVLNVQECPSCAKLQHHCENLAGICTDCWIDNPDLAEQIDFDRIPDDEIARHWWKLEKELFGYKATGLEREEYRCQFGPKSWLLAASIEATIGKERMSRILVRDWRGPRTGYWSWNAMRWVPMLGLVPHIGDHPEVGDYQGWRTFWHTDGGTGRKRCFVTIQNAKLKKAA
jgi:hypothetical protein